MSHFYNKYVLFLFTLIIMNKFALKKNNLVCYDTLMLFKSLMVLSIVSLQSVTSFKNKQTLIQSLKSSFNSGESSLIATT
jgi:hypothetical protein